ncbi:hypothetical protein RDV89_01815 [Nocardioides zeae]|uniref:Anti-sigma factor n=1 Tax=Nocardioides imazamoxiresistens TaxID=3231893 RepID=A0ABU3PRE2_9ACTN|nr:hypothetical protein [Nocardioides zeae]MDT9591787.1 hypothetical protein [Nocardioides zeae]
MSTTPEQQRREELVAAAATGDLDAAERAELDALCAADPALAAEVAELTLLSDRVGDLDPWLVPTPAEPAAEPAVAPVASRPRRAPLLAAAAALVVGAGLGAVATGVLSDGDPAGGPGDAPAAAPTGPPGTLGAHEPVRFEGESSPGADDPDGATDVDAVLVAHTWGTEAVLDVEGLEAGATYEVSFVASDGERYSAGAFLGSEVPIHCSLNAAVLREDVRELVIEAPDGAVVRTAALPVVDG